MSSCKTKAVKETIWNIFQGLLGWCLLILLFAAAIKLISWIWKGIYLAFNLLPVWIWEGFGYFLLISLTLGVLAIIAMPFLMIKDWIVEKYKENLYEACQEEEPCDGC